MRRSSEQGRCEERLNDFFAIEREYLDAHPDSAYFTELKGVTEFPDYIDYLPKGYIPKKIEMLYYMPEINISDRSFIAFTREEYQGFLDRAVEKVVAAIAEK